MQWKDHRVSFVVEKSLNQLWMKIEMKKKRELPGLLQGRLVQPKLKWMSATRCT